MCLCKGICVCRLRMKYCVFSAYEIVYLLESIHTRTLKKEILLKTQINNYAADTGWKSERLLICMVRLHCTLQEGAAAELTQSFWFWFGAATVHPTELLPEMQEWKEYICCSRPFFQRYGVCASGQELHFRNKVTASHIQVLHFNTAFFFSSFSYYKTNWFLSLEVAF